MTQKEYCEKMNAMFHSSGWRECFKPGLQRLREEQVQTCCFSLTWEDTLAARHALNMVDTILAFEDSVAEMEKTLVSQPAEADDVVELPVATN